MNFRRSLAALTVAALTACWSPGGRFGEPPAPSAPAQRTRGSAVYRGKVEKLWRVGTIQIARMEKGLYGEVIDEIGGKPKCDVQMYGMLYDTIGVHGEPAQASAAFFVPGTGCKAPYPLVGYSHGTNPVRYQRITKPSTTSPTGTAPDQDPIVVASIYAAHGYATVATDYLGLGLSHYPYHPYLQAASEASAVIDSLRAARNAAVQLKIRLLRRTFVSGHSQGGQSTMATQRELEAMGNGEFDLRGSVASSGPYALTQTFEDSLHHQSQDAPILAAYILPGYEKTYGNVYTDPSKVFKQPYAAGIDGLLPVRTYGQEAELYGKELPLELHALLQPSFYTSFLTDPTSGARVDTGRNDLLQGWTPKTYTYLCGGSRDPEVEFKNAELADAFFLKAHAPVLLVDVNSLIPKSVPTNDYHVVVALFCLPLGRKAIFDPLAFVKN